MIKSLKINNLRNIKNFDSGNFLKYNIIYASNGSGKSNISKFLNFHSLNSYIDNLDDLKSLEAKKNNQIITWNIEKDLNDKIYVYNEEFTKRCININGNFSDKEHNGKIILSKIGEENLEIEKLEIKVVEIEKKGKNIKANLIKNLDTKINELKNKYSAIKSTFSNELKLENLTEEIIKGYKIKEDSYKDFDNIKKIDEKSQIDKKFLELEILDVENIKNLIVGIYDFENESNEIEKYIKENVSKIWIEEGLKFHKNGDICPFCQQTIINKRIIEQYKGFIESKKSKFLSNIDLKIEIIKNIEKNIKGNSEKATNGLEDKVKLLKQTLGLQNTYNNLINIDNLEYIKKLLEEKKDKLKEVLGDKDIILKLSNIKKSIENYNQKIKDNNDFIKKINDKINDTGNRKTTLRKEIAKNELVKFFNDNKIEINEREKLLEEHKVIKEKIKIEKLNLPKTNKKEIIVKILNQLLEMLYLQKYKIDENFNLMLICENSEHHISQNTELISNGEKNVISFCYYVASIVQHIDKIEDLENLTLVIDDPVESTSYNYLHGISVIISKIGEIINKNFGNENQKVISPQYIILTHNLNFYNGFLANKSIGKKFTNVKGKIFYLKTENGFCTGLKEINKNSILSEFDTSLKIIIDYKKNSNGENIGIHIRRVLESICTFYNLDYSGNSIGIILGKESLTNNINQFISHDYSHLNYQKCLDGFPTDNLINVVNEIYDGLKGNLFTEKIKYIENLEGAQK